MPQSKAKLSGSQQHGLALASEFGFEDAGTVLIRTEEFTRPVEEGDAVTLVCNHGVYLHGRVKWIVAEVEVERSADA
jgi:hypothetical protein